MVGEMDIKFEPLILYYFYSEVLLYFENEVKKRPTGFRITDSTIRLYLVSNGIYPSVVDNKQELDIPDDLGQSRKPFITCRKNSKYSILVSFLEHCRNCFAHGLFSLYDVDGELWVSLKDKAPRGGGVSMVAQMPFIVFFGLMRLVKKA